MTELRIPEGYTTPVSLSDEVMKWQRIKQSQQATKMAEMQAAQEQEAMQNNQRLKALYSGGGRPTADQLYQIDPRMGMEFESKQASMDANKNDRLLKQLPVLKDIMSQIREKALSTGVQPGTPEFQQVLDQVGSPYRPYIGAITGEQNDKPLDWQAINAVADAKVGMDQQDWIIANDAKRGSFVLNKKTRELMPLEYEGQQIRPPQYSPDLQGEIMAAKESQKGVKVTGPDMRDTYTTQGAASGGRIGGVPAIDATEQDALLQAAREDNPDVRMRDAARARIEQISEGQPQPIKGPTPGEVETDKQSAKNEAEIAMEKQKRINSVQRLLGTLDRKIDGEEIESLINRSTGGLVEKTRDKIAGSFNQSTEGAKALAKLRPIQEWATSLVPRMEGPQSNFDVDRYRAMAGDIANPDLPVDIRKESYKALKQMLQDFLKSEGEAKQTTGGVKFMGFE